MGALGDSLEIIRAMLAPGRASHDGRFAHVRGAINVPKGIQQPRIPIIVGGNGERVTAGYAIRYADELNYVFLDAPEVAARMVSVRARCEAEGRDPATLRFSLYTRDEEMREPGQARVDAIGGSPPSASTGSSASRLAGRRRPTHRRPSPRTVVRPG